MPSFDLLDEPWLPCLTPASQPVEVGLRDLIAHCHEYRELFDPSPLVTIALHRLLLALVRRVYGISNDADWRALRSAGRFDPAAAERYFSRFADRFDLLDPERPFMQAKLDPNVRLHPGALLSREAASGNNPTLFDHSVDAKPRPLAPGLAARCLVAAQATALGGGFSEPFNFCDATLARDCTALVYGRTLFETLLLNSPPASPASGDAPVWEWDDDIVPEREGTPVPGPMSLFTWPARRIRLVADEDSGLITACQMLQGFVPEAGHHDPQKAYQRDQHGNLAALRLTTARAVWRDLPRWLGATPDTSCPDALTWLRTIHAGRGGGSANGPLLQLVVFGLATAPGRASVFLWRQDRYPLPDICLGDSEVVHEYIAAQARSEACYEALATALSFLNKLLNVPAEAIESTLADAGLNYWARLDRDVRNYLLVAAADPKSAAAQWNAQVSAAAAEAFAMALARLSRLAGHARGTAAAERFLTQRLAAIMAPTGGRTNEGGGAAGVH